MRNTIEYLLKHNIFLQKAYQTVLSAFFRLIGIFIRTDDRLILFSAFNGKNYNDSPKAVYEYMKMLPECASFRFVWAFEHPNQFPKPDCEKVKTDTWKYFITALKAKYWVTNVNIGRGLHFKKKATVYLNTWHGTGPKKGGNAVNGRKDYNFSDIDILCCDGEYLKEIMIRDFGASEENILMCGRPREDELYHATPEKVRSCREKLNLPPDKKVILYAPTWRDSKNGGKSYPLDLPIHPELWEKELKDDYIVLIRAHSLVTDLMKINYTSFIRNVSAHPDINDLYLASDLLISDYSSAFTDYSILSKPMLCFAYDYASFDRERGLYFDLRDHFDVLFTEDELLQKIKNLDSGREREIAEKYRNHFIRRQDNATQQCVRRLLELSQRQKSGE
ncbi:MAG TPA: CDP-glycerol glycerophosphotransferase family protein [Oscillospiraceae bacterium]|nr:CDP-glycerol glycerophosphotransferase family protein [Oscillospiraceae bacterium]HPF54929.1 CDP-glycerol glycerophosphotransferase family protein [Clostridiales bacterium]HPK34988.1 CDP-glycerol glycerophosphotransferase family protein [Oscillospiraceae bacterium]